MTKLTALAFAGFSMLLTASPAAANDAVHPTVVELFQSQGCSSCPPAIANINKLAARPDILPLTFAVTYWDQLGWKDTFADPKFTSRQWDYAHANGRGNVATPQTIINGRVVANGGDRHELISAIRSADRGQSGPTISTSSGNLEIGGGGTPAPAIIWLVRYDPREIKVPIRAGENDGRTIAHRNVVRSLTAISHWSGRPATIKLPPIGRTSLASAILVQRGTGGPIIAALKL